MMEHSLGSLLESGTKVLGLPILRAPLLQQVPAGFQATRLIVMTVPAFTD